MDKKEYEDLIKLINYHMDLYYNQDESEISDYEYDQLMIKLKFIEKDHPEWIMPDSPSQKIGGVAKREAGVKVTHDVPMLSIEDVFKKEDVVTWVNKVASIHPDCLFSVETKIDGLSMNLRYERNKNNMLELVLAETRGDGLIGEDVTANAYAIPDVKRYIDLPYDSLQLRGEVYMSLKDFERYNEIQSEKGGKPAANPRNLAAGTLRQLDSFVVRDRHLKMYIFNVQKGPSELTASHCDGLDILAEHNVPVVFHRICKNAEEILAAIDEIDDMRSDLPYDIDGAVIKVDQTDYRSDFPAGSKYSSGHIAYKYPPEERAVVLEDILVDVGRTGKLTFTGVFSDKETGCAARLCGTRVSRATLHNRDYIRDMQIGVGGVYILYKSGEIIPKLKECVEPPKSVFDIPYMCPVCGSKLQAEGDCADVRCINAFCGAQLSRTISYFASVEAMNILGLGDSIIDIFIKHGYISNFADIYRLNCYRNEIEELPRFRKNKEGEKSRINNILDEIEKSKNNNPIRLLTGLGIRNVGKNTAKSIMKHFSSILEVAGASYDQLIEIDDIGDITAQAIIDYFENPNNKTDLFELRDLGVNMVMPKEDNNGESLAGLIFVVTGTLPTLGRKEVTDLIERNGGKCTSAVSKKTDYLVVGDSPGSKLDKAQVLGIPVLSEKELLTMIVDVGGDL